MPRIKSQLAKAMNAKRQQDGISDVGKRNAHWNLDGERWRKAERGEGDRYVRGSADFPVYYFLN